MKLDFRIDWGYQYLYSRRHYHPVYRWDGTLECTEGTIQKCWKLDYPVIWFGPGHCAHETLLEAPRWESSTRRGVSGIRVLADVKKGATFTLKTQSGNFVFTAQDIQERGRLEFAVSPKYLGCKVVVTRTGYFWYMPPAAEGEQLWHADDLKKLLPVHDWARIRTAWLAPGERLKLPVEIPAETTDFTEQLLHLAAMIAPGYTPGDEQQCCAYMPVVLYCDGKKVAQQRRYFRKHDDFMQMLEDLWLTFQARPGKHLLELENGHASYWLLINRLSLRQHRYNHLQLSLPQWALAGEELIGRIFAVRADKCAVRWPGGEASLALRKGWNEFRFTLKIAERNVAVTTSKGTEGVIDAVYALRDETPEVTVGYDMTVVPHDDSGSMEWLLDYTWRTRLGNLVVFRAFLDREPSDENLARWGAFCRDHHIYVEAATSFDSGALCKAAGKMLHSVGRHEWPGAVYAFDPTMEWRSEDMKTAMEHYIKRLKIEIDRAHKVARRAAFGDASGGHRYCYMAGVDFIRTETMVPHTQHICSQARPAAETLGSGEWGVHIAIQHCYQLYSETHLGQYFLSIFQPWMMGASMIYEEDSLFELFKEERQAWDDALTKGKRDMTRAFYRFVKTHPRQGRPVRKIAFVEGRYAAPFNGFICDTQQTPDYSVWGLFGSTYPCWGHRQPEKCRQLLDVLMPGASTQPLRQDFTKRRFFFSGTPYGDFDEVPTEASADYLGQYSLLLHLGWNTMIPEDYDKLASFVRQGGTLLIGLPQFSTHVRREFLEEMTDLALWHDGDLSELCGVKVRGIAERFSGDWNCAEREAYPVPDLSGIPSKSFDEDGPCHLADVELCGAVPLIWDSTTGRPLVVAYRHGQGTVYLLTAYAYPGHEALRQVMGALVAKLCGDHLPECHVEDPSRELFWNEWLDPQTGVRQLMLLNTDWTTAGNTKTATIHTPHASWQTTVVERQPKTIWILPDGTALEPEDCVNLWLQFTVTGKGKSARLHITAHGVGRQMLRIRKATKEGGVLLQKQLLDFAQSTCLDITL